MRHQALARKTKMKRRRIPQWALLPQRARGAAKKQYHPCKAASASSPLLYAIRFLLKGGKLFALQRRMGHESLEMVKIYAHFTDQDAEEEKRKYSPADDVVIDPQRTKRRGFRNG